MVECVFDAERVLDFAAVASLFTDGIAWHQPGKNRFSGTHVDGAAVAEVWLYSADQQAEDAFWGSA